MTEPIKVGSIVQVKPDANAWRGCLVIVTEVRAWGIQGFTPMPPDGGYGLHQAEDRRF